MEVLDDFHAVLDGHLPVNAAELYVVKLHVVLVQVEHCGELKERVQRIVMWEDCNLIRMPIKQPSVASTLSQRKSGADYTWPQISTCENM